MIWGPVEIRAGLKCRTAHCCWWFTGEVGPALSAHLAQTGKAKTTKTQDTSPDHDTRFLHAHTQTHITLHTGLKLVSCILQNLFYVPFYLSAHFDDHSFVDFMWLCLINNSLSLHPKCSRLTSLFWDLKASVSDIWKTSPVIQQHYRLFSVNGGHLSKRMTIILMENVAKK